MNPVFTYLENFTKKFLLLTHASTIWTFLVVTDQTIIFTLKWFDLRIIYRLNWAVFLFLVEHKMRNLWNLLVFLGSSYKAARKIVKNMYFKNLLALKNCRLFSRLATVYILTSAQMLVHFLGVFHPKSRNNNTDQW